MPTPISNVQPYLALSRAFVMQGIFPARDGGGGSGVTLDMIRTYAFSFAPAGAALAQGQLIPIAQNTAVFSLIGTTYGGNGTTNFALPNLSGRFSDAPGQGPGLSLYDWGQLTGTDSFTLLQSQLPANMGGTSNPVDNHQPTLSTGYFINAIGIFPSSLPTADTIGVINEFAGNFGPNGAIPCDGRLLLIADYDTLFAVIGTTYGGDGQTTFAVPDLRGRVPVGTGTRPGSSHTYVLGEAGGGETIVIGQANEPAFYSGTGLPTSNVQPYLALTMMVALQGIFPSQNAENPEGVPEVSAIDDSIPFLGEIIMFAGSSSFFGNAAQANGQLLPINQNQALFALLGTNFGGNGTTNFALPDLRGRAVEGTGAGVFIGQSGGTESFTLTLDNIPSLVFDGTNGDDQLLGGNSADTITGSDGNDSIFGAGGSDMLRGGKGNDTLDGGTGANTLVGGAGNDRLVVGTGASGSDVQGGADNDTLVVTGAVSLANLSSIEVIEFQSGGNLTLTQTQFAALPANTAVSGAGTLTVNMTVAGAVSTSGFVFSGGLSQVAINGSSGADVIICGSAQHTINGGAGIDRIDGGSAADTINGGLDGDKITGRGGADILTGGDGSDVFKYDAIADSGIGSAADRITDYAVGVDRLNFKDIDPDGVTAGDQAFTFIGAAAFGATGVAQIRYLTAGADIIVQADANGDGAADMEIILQGIGGQTLTVGDLVL
jgi:microcystin-dependent protein